MEGQARRLRAEVYCGRQIMRRLYTLFGQDSSLCLITSEGNYRLKVAGTLERGIVDLSARLLCRKLLQHGRLNMVLTAHKNLLSSL